MSDPVAWLRQQVEAELAAARLVIAACDPDCPQPCPYHPAADAEWAEPFSGTLQVRRDGTESDVWYGTWAMGDSRVTRFIAGNDPRSRIADCEAKLAIIDRCAPLLPPDPEDLDEHYHDGRDPDEQMRDEALADLADEVLALLADGYRHRPGWVEHWACPGCGKAIREVPVGHMWGIPLGGGPWTCSDPAGPPVSPEEFMRG